MKWLHRFWHLGGTNIKWSQLFVQLTTTNGFFDFLGLFVLSISNVTYCLIHAANFQLNDCILLITSPQVSLVSTRPALCLRGCPATNGFKLMHTMHMNQNTEINPKDCGGAAGQFCLNFAFHYKPDSDSHVKYSKNILCVSKFSCLSIWEYLIRMTRFIYQIPENIEKNAKRGCLKSSDFLAFFSSEDSFKTHSHH